MGLGDINIDTYKLVVDSAEPGTNFQRHSAVAKLDTKGQPWNKHNCHDFENKTYVILWMIPPFDFTGVLLEWVLSKVITSDYDLEAFFRKMDIT